MVDSVEHAARCATKLVIGRIGEQRIPTAG